MKNLYQEFKPFLSLFILISSLFLIVFFKMEERRINYELLKLNKDLKLTLEKRRVQEINLAKFSRPERIEKEIRMRTAFSDPSITQIIHMSGGRAFERVIPRGVQHEGVVQ